MSDRDEPPYDVDGKVGVQGVLAVFVMTLAADPEEDLVPDSTVGSIGSLRGASDGDITSKGR